MARCVAWLTLCLVAVLPAEPAQKGDIDVTASVSATRIGMEDTLLLTLTFQGVQSLSSPELEKLGDFRVLQTSQQFESHTVNQTTTSAILFTYTLAPRRLGTLTIPAFSFDISGKTYRTTPFQIEVVKGSVNPSSSPPASPFDLDRGLPQAARTPQEQVEVTLKTKLSKPAVLVGEQVIFSVLLYTRGDIEGVSPLSSSSIPGFWQEWFPTPQRISGSRESVNGVSYRVFEIRKAALFPTASGTLTIPSQPFQVDVPDPNALYFGSRSLPRSSPETTIQVLPLPADQANLPVGTFTLDARCDRSTVDMNDLSTLTITITGTGNTKALTPPLPISGEAFIVYPPKITHETAFLGESLQGKLVAEVPISFQRAGAVEIPPILFQYVDPKTRKTVSLQSGAIALQVTGTKAPFDSTSTPEQSAIVRKAEDIGFIAGGRLRDQGDPLSRRPWFLLLLLLPFAGNALFMGKRLLWDQWLSQSHAWNQRKLLAQVLRQLSAVNSSEEVAAILDRYLTARTGMGFSELSNQKVKEIFRQQGISAQATDHFFQIKTQSEFAKYSPQKRTGRELEKDLAELRKLIVYIDKKIK